MYGKLRTAYFNSDLPRIWHLQMRPRHFDLFPVKTIMPKWECPTGLLLFINERTKECETPKLCPRRYHQSFMNL